MAKMRNIASSATRTGRSLKLRRGTDSGWSSNAVHGNRVIDTRRIAVPVTGQQRHPNWNAQAVASPAWPGEEWPPRPHTAR